MAAARLPSAIKAIPPSARIGVSSAVHIKIHPRPRNLAESREVLRVLQQYGEIVVYKHLKYEPQAPAPNTALAIFRSTSSAQNLLDASPLRFELQEGKTEWTPVASDSTALDVAEKKRDKEQWIAFEEEQQKKTQKEDPVQEDEDIIGDDSSGDNSVGAQFLKPVAGTPSLPSKGSRTKWGTTFASVKSEQHTFTSSPSPPLKSSPLKSSPFKSSPPPTFTSDHPPPHSTNPVDEIPSSHPTPLPDLPTVPPPRELQLNISRSVTNHEAYIKRQGYYGSFVPNRKTIMAEDLEDRVPLEGMVDVSLSKAEVPLRIRIKKQEKQAQRRVSLRELWEEGRRDRESGTP